jgi:hypothetical protein
MGALVSDVMRRKASIAVLVLLSLFAGTIPGPHVDGLGDPDCLPLFAGHNESAHHFSAVSSARTDNTEHCFLCHSLRSLHQPHERHQQRDLSAGSEQLHIAGPAVAAHSEWSPTAGRAPPHFIW